MVEISVEIKYSGIYGKKKTMTNSTSWQAKFASAYFRKVIRTPDWGEDDFAVARRARKFFGAPQIIQWLKSRGIKIDRVEKGEWLTPQNPKETILFYIHGGGFVASSPEQHRPITASLARLGNFKVFSVDYRLAPEHRFPAALDDVFSAYQWLLNEGFSPDKIAIAGDSAGGGLVLSSLLKIREENLPFPVCGVCFSPWTDLAITGESIKMNSEKDAMFYPQTGRQFAKAYLGGTSPLEKYASPVYADYDTSFPPILFQVGSTEGLLNDSTRIHRKLGERSELEIYEDTPHCWQMLDSFLPEARIALKRAVGFMNKHFNPPPAI